MNHLDDVTGKAVLSRVSYYHLQDIHGQMDIRVREFLNGPTKGHFIACPYRVDRGEANFLAGQGSTLDEALHNCLTKMKRVPLENIFPELL